MNFITTAMEFPFGSVKRSRTFATPDPEYQQQFPKQKRRMKNQDQISSGSTLTIDLSLIDSKLRDHFEQKNNKSDEIPIYFS